jgi:hypothetical protein
MVSITTKNIFSYKLIIQVITSQIHFETLAISCKDTTKNIAANFRTMEVFISRLTQIHSTATPSGYTS